MTHNPETQALLLHQECVEKKYGASFEECKRIIARKLEELRLSK